MLRAKQEIEVDGVPMCLWGLRAAQIGKMVVVGDVHLGKAGALARGGLGLGLRAIEGAVNADLARLSQVLEQSGATSLVFAGDLFHHQSGCDAQTLCAIDAWRKEHANVRMILAKGNHDKASAKGVAQLEELDIRVVDVLVESELGVGVVHDLEDVDAKQGLWIGGHIHPAVRLGGVMTCSCFWLRAFRLGGFRLTLPAFGSMTGSKVIEPGAGDRVFIVGKRGKEGRGGGGGGHRDGEVGDIAEVPMEAISVRGGKGRLKVR